VAGALAGGINSLGNIIQTGDVSARAVSDVFGNHAIARANIQNALVGVNLQHFDELIELLYIGKAVLAEVVPKNPLTKFGVRGAVRGERIKLFIKTPHHSSFTTILLKDKAAILFLMTTH
jgi:hypothetical protein